MILLFKLGPAVVPRWGAGLLPPGRLELLAFAVALGGSVACTWLLKRLPLFKTLL